MRPIILLAAVSCTLNPVAVLAEEYIVRLETVGYVDRPMSEEASEEVTLRSIEVVARVGAAFHGKVAVRKETLRLTGELRPASDGRFTVEFRYEYKIDTGTFGPTADGGWERKFAGDELLNTATLALDDPVAISGSDTVSGFADGRQLKSKLRDVLVVTRYEAEEPAIAPPPSAP